MKTKAPHPSEHLPRGHGSPFLAAYFELLHLKHLYRQGWLHRGIPEKQCESVADHCFGVALLAYFLAEEHFPELDLPKVLRLALLHDVGEVYAGDLTPADGVSAGEKHERERQSVVRVLGKLPRGPEYVALWEEYERQESPEARFVRKVDRLEMALQAGAYEHLYGADLSELFASARDGLNDPPLRRLLAELDDLRPPRAE